MIFKPAARYPADPRAIFILAVSVFTGLTALALDVAPGSLNSLLPRWSVLLWGALLLSGSVLSLLGMSRQSVNGIIMEQIGSVMVGVTTIFYSVIVLAEAPEAAQGLGIILAWGLACLIRWGQLQALIRQGVEQATRDALLQEFEDTLHEEQIQAYRRRRWFR